MNETKKITAYLGVGSNVGDRKNYLKKALKLIEKEANIEVEKVSHIYETEPWPKHEIKNGRPVENEKQNWHLNQVIRIETSLEPMELLRTLQNIEVQMGKQQKLTWGSREIDIDLLLYDNEILETDEIKIPHPYMQERQFVLIPLSEIAPELIDPRSKKPFQEYLNEISEEYIVRKYEGQ